MCFFEDYKFAWFLYLELYNYTNIVANGFIISKLSNLVALQNRYFILQKTLHELLFCDNFVFFCRNNLRILRLKLAHVVVVKHVLVI